MAGPTAAGAVLAGRTLVGAAACALLFTTSFTMAPAGPSSTVLTGSGSLRGSEWALSALRADRAWQTSRGQGVTVAVIGTGVDAAHPDLKGRVVKGADLTDGASGDGTRDQGVTDVQGTHAAGIIAGTGRNYHGDGVYGLAPQARVLPVRVYRDSAPVAAATAAGIRYAARKGAQVIDVAVSFRRPSKELRSAVAYAVRRNCLVVAGAGDTGQSGNAVSYPAAYRGVLSVAATDKKGGLWPDSHYGRDVALTAPGVDILTTARNDDYWTGSGTAYAASWVAASAALVRAEHPQWTAAGVAKKLTDTASHQTSAHDDVHHGYGTVDPARALTASASPAADPQHRTAPRSSDTGPILVVVAVTGALLVLAVLAWLLIRRSVTPSDQE
ncbi:S8 family serine peptidase [Streptomyces antnestii]|uniref:S8 family serine peptidase n=1 Tax=Streptomyces antnestii TaxID=2494256 RepID=UPI001CB950C6|nr:S8 family serine peptidase [Streptomyces sp. San01]